MLDPLSLHYRNLTVIKAAFDSFATLTANGPGPGHERSRRVRGGDEPGRASAEIGADVAADHGGVQLGAGDVEAVVAQGGLAASAVAAADETLSDDKCLRTYIRAVLCHI